MPPEFPGNGVPGELLGQDFSRGISVDEGYHAPAGAGVAGVRKRAQNDVEAVGGFFNGGFGKARDLEEAARHESIAGGIEGGGGFGFVRSDGRVGIEVCAGADANFKFVEGAIGFDDAMPAEGRAGLGESGHSAGRLTPIRAGFHGRQSIAMEDEAHANVENHRDEREARPDSSPRAFRFGTDFLRDQPAERGKKNSSEKNSEKPEIQVGDPVEREAAR